MSTQNTLERVEHIISEAGQVVSTVVGVAPEVKMALGILQGFFAGLKIKADDIDLTKLEAAIKALPDFKEDKNA